MFLCDELQDFVQKQVVYCVALCCAVLCCVVLCCVVLCCVVLCSLVEAQSFLSGFLSTQRTAFSLKHNDLEFSFSHFFFFS